MLKLVVETLAWVCFSEAVVASSSSIYACWQRPWPTSTMIFSKGQVVHMFELLPAAVASSTTATERGRMKPILATPQSSLQEGKLSSETKLTSRGSESLLAPIGCQRA